MESIIGAELPIDRRARVNTLVQEPTLRCPEERICDFEPVFLPLTPESAQRAAECCIHCPDPAMCFLACPAGNDIPSAMWLIERGDFLGAAKLYRQTSSLPEICGRVCPHESLCQGACIRSKDGDPVLTGLLEAFVTDYEREHGQVELQVGPPTGRKIAIVGSGPSGLSCAERLIQKGHSVTVFEKLPAPGGLLLYGIPDFKLPKSVVQARIDDFLRAGVEFETGVEIGKDRTIDALFAEGFEAVYIAVGTWLEAPLDVPGVELPGIFRASEFLMQAKLWPEYLPQELSRLGGIGRRVVVIGGGDTASDCLRTALRLGAEEVTCLYRRTEAQMPGNHKDRKLTEEEGAVFRYLTQPIGFRPGSDGRVAEIECLACELGAPDRSGRRRPIPIEGSNFTVAADTVVLALGYWPDPALGETTPGLETHRWGLIVADEASGATSRPGVYAGATPSPVPTWW